MLPTRLGIQSKVIENSSLNACTQPLLSLSATLSSTPSQMLHYVARTHDYCPFIGPIPQSAASGWSLMTPAQAHVLGSSVLLSFAINAIN
jgi:hypothetical protein